MNKKSPANFGLMGLSGAAALVGRGGGRKSRKIARSTNKRVKEIQKTLEEMNAGDQAVPTEGGLAEVAAGSVEESLDANDGIETPGMESPTEVPSAVQEDEDTYATAGSALGMMKKIARRK
tara:strand:- start:210 stop:572 length:363 start_codon:yes stop_codon:yes gene_type:complete